MPSLLGENAWVIRGRPALANLNIKATTNVTDPLDRLNSTGQPLAVPLSNLTSYWDASGTSSFHAAIVNSRRQLTHLTFYTNFRWSKSIDEASDVSPDKNARSFDGKCGRTRIQFRSSGIRRPIVIDDSIPYVWNLVGVYDLPSGKGRAWGQNAWGPLQPVAGWTVSGVERLSSGYPFTPTIGADNFIDTEHTREIQPNLIPVVLLVNPDWSRNCPIGKVCAPYANYSAFELPPAGQIGNAPRTIAGLTGPMVQRLDLSVQQEWVIGEKRKIQFRLTR
ncbi:MAG: hypothetical protein JO108_19270 [Acidobacteriaceae bacterium]|nr:hypothetical protein [Acidobacteriaceae bacterium]